MNSRIPRKRAPLTNEQRQHRRDNDLCMYCGDPEHKVTECFRIVDKKRRTGADSMILETPLSARPNAPPIGTTQNERNETSRDVGFLAIPRELRNKIYEELLYMDDLAEFQIQQYAEARRLHPAILGVSRQISHEASEVLYDKNGWITITAVDTIMTSAVCNAGRYSTGYPGCSQAFTRYEGDRLSRSAILDMKIQHHSDSNVEMIDVVIPLAAMSRFCRRLTQSHWVDTLDLAIHFNHRAKQSHQSRLLSYIGQARGLWRVNITSTEPPWAAVNTVLLMTHPHTSSAEFLSTALAYQMNSEYESNHGRTLAARNLAQDGVAVLDWWLDQMATQVRRREPVNENELDEILQARADIGFSCVALSLRVGDILLAQQTVEVVLYRISIKSGLSEIHKACAHYHMAQTFEPIGWRNAALYSYLQALRIRPGYQDADAAVDHMEQHLGAGTSLEDSRLKHNIHHVLGPFRHQPAGSVVVSNREYNAIFQGFEGTAAEIRSLDRDISGAETDVVYMNPTIGVITGRIFNGEWMVRICSDIFLKAQ